MEVTIKVVENDTVLPHKRGVLSISRGECLVKELGEWHVYPVHSLLRGYEPIDSAAREIMEKLKNGS